MQNEEIINDNDSEIKDNEEIDNTIINSFIFIKNFTSASISAGAVICTGIYLIISVIVLLILYPSPSKPIDMLEFSYIGFISFIICIFSAIPCILATIFSLLSGRMKLFIFNILFILINVILTIIAMQ